MSQGINPPVPDVEPFDGYVTIREGISSEKLDIKILPDDVGFSG